ncbi:MAG: hypothetical protein V4628_09310 [Pseudomonadota bacterium]
MKKLLMKNLAMKNTHRLFTALAAAAFSCGMLAMEAVAPQPNVDVEEIVVTGERSLVSLRIEADKAEDVVYELFNELNTEDRYDVHCATETRVLSHIKQRHCRTGFELEAMQAEAQYLLSRAAGNATAAPTPVNIAMNAELPGFQATMKKIVEQNPALLEAVIKHAKLREELRVQREARFNAEDK